MSHTNSLVITHKGSLYDISIVVDKDESGDVASEYREEYLKQKAQNINKLFVSDGQVEVYSGQTGKKMTTGTFADNYYQLNTAGWPIGIYVVRVVRGEEVYTEKIQIK